MRIMSLAAACLLSGAILWGAPAVIPPIIAEPLTAPKRLFDAGKYSEVIPALPSQTMQKLRGKDLRLATLFLAVSYERTRQLDKALSVYQLGIKLFPKDIDLLEGLARLFHTSHLEEQSQALYNKILEIEPNNTSAHLGLASIDRILGFLDRSAKHYETALEQVKDSAGIWREYAEVLYEQRDYKTAELAILKSLELSPQIIDSKLDLAFIQRAQARSSEALASIEEALALTGNPADLVATYALWLLEAEKFRDALAQSTALLKEAPSDPLARWIRAEANLRLGRRGAAIEDLEIAAASDPDSFIAKTSNVLLKQLRKTK